MTTKKKKSYYSKKIGDGFDMRGRILGASLDVDRYGRPLKGRGRKSGAIIGGSMACPLIINLTKHDPGDVMNHNESGEEFEIRNLHGVARDRLLQLQDFSSGVPEYSDICGRAIEIANLARNSGCKYAWIGGAPYLMGVLENELKKRNITPLYSWSRRDYFSRIDENGQIRMEMFRIHSGWVQIS